MSDSIKNKTVLSEGDFMRLFVKHEPALRAFARTLLPDWHSVDEALQEASVTMWEKLGQLNGEGGFLPWGKVIVRFKCLSIITSLRRDRFLLSDTVIELLAREAEMTEAEEHMIARQALRSCLDQFSETHRELLFAPYSGDGKVIRLAENQGKSTNALYKMLGRLRTKLSSCVRSQLNLEAL